MITKDIRKLLEKLNDLTTRALESAAGFCVSRTHYQVTIEHLLAKLMEEGTGDIQTILTHFHIDSGKVWENLLKTIDGFKQGNTGRPSFSPVLLNLFESAIVASMVHHNLTQVRSGVLLEVLLQEESSKATPYMDVLSEINNDELRKSFFEIVKNSSENKTPALARPAIRAEGPQKEGETALDLYCNNFTQQARDNKIDPVFGRDKEIRQMIDILSRRRKNNPILVGEPGVGKTAIVEGLALRIVSKDVPTSLLEVELLVLDLGLLQAGAGVKGEFENRLKSVISEVKESPKPIILFIDEAHTLIGAGGAAGGSDAANLLKPALARGELRTIAATTWAEYKKYFERDAALARRFQLVKIDEPSPESACTMLRGLKEKYEGHHKIHVSDEAIEMAVRLSDRYIAGRQLPDKAVDLLDTASARVKMGQSAKPAQLDDLDHQIENLNIEIKAVKRDLDSGILTDSSRLLNLEKEISNLQIEQMELEERWKKELELVQRINENRTRLAQEKSRLRENNETTSPAVEELAQQVEKDKQALITIQGKEPLIHAEVNGNIAAQVVSDWTGIPAGKMMKDEADALLSFEKNLKQRIRGQDYAINEIANSIRIAKAGLREPEKPLGVFLLVGPSGVGKTECARGIADLLFGGERFVITINMSEYQESHTVSQLKGSPPGYVGYGEGGVLTEAVRQRPYSVVILDEVEKAHRDVMNLFYQVFDRGFMRDGEGREIDFKNTVIMMTSNLGSDIMMQMMMTDDENPSSEVETDDKKEATPEKVAQKPRKPTPGEMAQAIRPILLRYFQPALLARFKVVPFIPLDEGAMKEIVTIKLKQVAQRLQDSHHIPMEWSSELVDRITERCTETETGARNIDFIIDRSILPDVSRELLGCMADEKMPDKLILELDPQGNFIYRFS